MRHSVLRHVFSIASAPFPVLVEAFLLFVLLPAEALEGRQHLLLCIMDRLLMMLKALQLRESLDTARINTWNLLLDSVDRLLVVPEVVLAREFTAASQARELSLGSVGRFLVPLEVVQAACDMKWRRPDTFTTWFSGSVMVSGWDPNDGENEAFTWILSEIRDENYEIYGTFLRFFRNFLAAQNA